GDDHAYPRGRRTNGRPHRRHRGRPADCRGHARGIARTRRPRPSEPRGCLPRAGRRGGGGVSAPGSVAWLAGHEFRLAWRGGRSMITAGRRRRGRTIVAILAVFALVMHGIAFAMLPRQIGAGDIDKATLLAITGCLVLSFSLLLSQSLESVTRAFYAR